MREPGGLRVSINYVYNVQIFSYCCFLGVLLSSNQTWLAGISRQAKWLPGYCQWTCQEDILCLDWYMLLYVYVYRLARIVLKLNSASPILPHAKGWGQDNLILIIIAVKVNNKKKERPAVSTETWGINTSSIIQPVALKTTQKNLMIDQCWSSFGHESKTLPPYPKNHSTAF